MRRLTDEQRDLAAEYVPLARQIAEIKARQVPGLAAEIESAAMWGLVDAASRYDGRVRFNTFATRRVRGAILDALRENGLKGYRRKAGQPRVVALWGASDRAEGDEAYADEATSEPLDPGGPVGWELESADAVVALTAGLSLEQRQVIRRAVLWAECRGVERAARSLERSHVWGFNYAIAGLNALRERAGVPPTRKAVLAG